MKILFIQKYLFAYIGVMSLSGFLKQNSHETSIIIGNETSEREMLRRIRETRPDIIGFSVLSVEHFWLAGMVRLIKDNFPHIPVVVGGIHAILYADEVMEIPGVDYVCRGEGEHALVQLLEYMQSRRPLQEVRGIKYREDGKIFETEMSSLIGLDEFDQDRDIYYDSYPALRDMPMKVFFSSRGCPYQCTFCVNKQLQGKFKGLGTYVRRKSVEPFIAEVEEVVSRFGSKFIFFADDLFVYQKEWLQEFCRLYRERVRVPFICTCRADMLDEEKIGYLTEAGCHSVTFGVETGDEVLRNSLLKKNIRDEQLASSAKLLKEAGIMLQTSNMFCLPGETIADAIRTIEFNIRIGATFSMSAIFMPFPKAELTEKCIEMGLLKPEHSFGDLPSSFITHSILDMKDKDVLARLQKVSGMAIQYPAMKNALIFAARHIRFDFVHYLIYLTGTVLRFCRERRLNVFQAMCYLWSYRKNV